MTTSRVGQFYFAEIGLKWVSFQLPLTSLRYSFLSKRDERRAVLRLARSQEITAQEANDRIKAISPMFSPIAFPLPNKSTKKAAPLYGSEASVLDIDYDKIVYDTYDYLDKVISLSLADPICAVFELHHKNTQDKRAKSMQNYIRYGTNIEKEIWLLRYGIDSEDIEWIAKHVKSIDEFNIEFRDSVLDEPYSRLQVIDRYL